MTLNYAHQGYEYQDLLTVYFILFELVNGSDVTFIIDKKNSSLDSFDDLTIERRKTILKKQIKYSDTHTLSKGDISADSNYQLAIDQLYESWKINKNNEVRLCLAWNEPVDKLTQVLIEKKGNKSFSAHFTRLFQLNIEKLWPNNDKPLLSWKRFREYSNTIDRNDFLQFCNQLYIETNFPKFSLNLDNPGELETIVLDQADKLGIGIFPNDHIVPINFIARLLLKVKEARSKGSSISSQTILLQFNIKTDYGAIEQNFPIDSQKNVLTKDSIKELFSQFQTYKKMILLGEPGCGKSWFVNNLIEVANKKKIHTIRHFCYTDLKDEKQKERIKCNTLYGNLIADIVKEFPELSKEKEHRFASTRSELNILLRNIQEPTILIIDGLDHINRVFDFYNYIDITKKEIQIIENLENIESSDNVWMLLTSQPISQLREITSFHVFELAKWTDKEVKSLLRKCNIVDQPIDDKTLSTLLLNKSEGNPLYLTYLIKEIQNLDIVTEATINNLPPYSFNLESYYNYLLSKLNTRESLPRVLSGVNFYLSKEELKEITGEGEYIEEALLALSSVLKLNTSQNGYIIYHESFRRYILDVLKNKNVSIEKHIFNPLIDWFKSKDLFSYSKAYRYGLQFYYDCNQFSELAPHICKEFIVKSVTWGQPWKLIEKNIYLLSRAAISLKDFNLIVIVNELFKTIESTSGSYEHSFEAYIECIGLLRGFEHVAKFLSYDGEPSVEGRQGLQACYIASSYNAYSRWDLYINYFEKGKQIKQEDFKFYLRYLLIQEDTEKLLKVADKINETNLSPLKNIFQHELNVMVNKEFQKELINERSIINLFNKNHGANLKNINDIIKQIKSINGYTENEVEIIADFIEQCRKYKLNNHTNKKIINQLSSINWFYNWLIYCVKITIIQNEVHYSFKEVKDAFMYLEYDTEPFKGKPRTCDLYYLEEFIYNTIKEGLQYLKDISEWKCIIKLLIKVSQGTETSLEGSVGGPIAIDKLFKLFEDVANPINVDYLLEEAIKLYEQRKDRLYYSYLADFCFTISKLSHITNKNEEAESYFLLGARYMVSYTWRRDMTLMDGINCVSEVAKINCELAKKELKKLNELTESVTQHTDGKDTKWLPIFWFQEYIKIDLHEAVLWLRNQLYQTRYYWVLERNLKDLIESTKGKINPLIEQFILNSFIVENDSTYLNVAIDLNKIIKKEDLALAYFFAQKLRSRLQYKRNSSHFEEIEKKVESHFATFDIAYCPKKESLSPKKDFRPNWEQAFRTIEFTDMTLSEIGEYINIANLSDSDINSLIYIIDKLHINEESKQLIINLITNKAQFRYERDINKEKLDILFEANHELKIYCNILLFIWTTSGYSSSLYLKDKFKEAYMLDSQKSIEYFFELLPIIFEGINKDLSSNLLNALIEIGYDSKIIINSFISLIEAIEYKTPIYKTKNWKEELNNELDLNTEEILITILLIRSKAYTTERLINTLAGLSIILHKDAKKMIKPLKWFFRKHEYFMESVILCILDILNDYNNTDPQYIKNFTLELEDMYPQKYYLIDCLLEKFLKRSPYITLFESQLTYPISPKTHKEFLTFNNRLKRLDYIGIDVSSVIGKHKTSYLSRYENNLDLYSNPTYERYVKHIYPSSFILENINKDLYQDLREAQIKDDDDLYAYLHINTKLLIAQFLSLSLRPDDLPLPSTGTEEIKLLPINSINGWIRLGHYEIELKKEDQHFNLKSLRSSGTFSSGFSNNTSIPLDSIYTPDTIFCSVHDGVLFHVNQYDPLENYTLFWLNPIMMEQLGIRIGDYLKGIFATNEVGETVLKLNQWKTYYVGNGDFGLQDEIPRLEGVELMIREDYFEKMKDILNIPLTNYTLFFLDLDNKSNQ